MRIVNLKLLNFRNYNHLTLSFSPNINVIYGKNGSGKTNLIEAIYVLGLTKSFRSTTDKVLVTKDKNLTKISGVVFDNINKEYQLTISGDGKVAKIDSHRQNKLSDYIAKVNIVLFHPDSLKVIKDSPGVRRNFLNKELSMLFPIYIKQLIAFKEILEERNNLLKKKIDYNLLEVINEKLVESSYIIYIRRKWLIEKIEEFATKIYFNVSNENKKVKIVYSSFINEVDKEAYLNKALKLYNDIINKDIERQYTINGIHKDDFKVYLADMLIDMYASQGQQRLISLCIKLAVCEIVSKANKSEPIIILDDAFSELDLVKKEKVFKYLLAKEQVFITCTNYQEIISKNIPLNTKVIKIKEGLVEERSSN